MINEISQNASRVQPLQLNGGSGSTNPVQEESAAEPSKVSQLSENEKVEATELIQPAAVDKKEVEEVVESLNDFAQSVSRQLQFTVDDESGKTVVKVIDADTGKTVRNIPSEEILDMQQHLKETSERLFRQEETGASLLFTDQA